MPPTKSKTLSAWEQHCARWQNGCGAEICDSARRICLARGEVPCDILFIGEAPGESEDVLGHPFVGPAGQLLDKIIQASIGEENQVRSTDGLPLLVHALTNLVGCIPREEDGAKSGQPDEPSIHQCKPRLEEFIRAVADQGERLRLIICVGNMAWDWTEPGYSSNVRLHRPIKRIKIKHPSAILKGPIVMKGLDIQRSIVIITQAIEDME